MLTKGLRIMVYCLQVFLTYQQMKIYSDTLLGAMDQLLVDSNSLSAKHMATTQCT